MNYKTSVYIDGNYKQLNLLWSFTYTDCALKIMSMARTFETQLIWIYMILFVFKKVE